MASHARTGNKKAPTKVRAFVDDPYGIRTHVIAVKGRCLNHLTKGPYCQSTYAIISYGFGFVNTFLKKFLEKNAHILDTLNSVFNKKNTKTCIIKNIKKVLVFI